MSEVVNFPSKEVQRKYRSAEEVLEKALEGVRSGDIDADQLIVVWCSETENRTEHSYMISGDRPLSSSVGLLEMTKSYLLTDE